MAHQSKVALYGNAIFRCAALRHREDEQGYQVRLRSKSTVQTVTVGSARLRVLTLLPDLYLYKSGMSIYLPIAVTA